jgi:N-acetylglucosamine kinase-like BadF-type ATPase
MAVFLGVDVGGTKTAALIADEKGEALGYGISGAGNYEVVGWDGFKEAVRNATRKALDQANRDFSAIEAAGMGIAGYDWPSLKEKHLAALKEADFQMKIGIVNDAVLGILAGTEHGWGVSVVSGTGCNCRGWSRDHKKEGRVVGGASEWSGEYAGGYDILARAMRAVAFEWDRRGSKTELTKLFIQYTGAKHLDDLIEGMYTGRYWVFDQSILLKVFEIADRGDREALNVLKWAGEELGGMACGVINQLEIHEEVFDIVLIGSVFKGHEVIADSLKARVIQHAPKARFVRLTVPPVVGGILLGMEQIGLDGYVHRNNLIDTTQKLIEKNAL